jgi:hypothetical protein
MKIEENYEEDYDEGNYDKEEDDEEPGRKFEADPRQERENQSDGCNYDDAEPQEPIMCIVKNIKSKRIQKFFFIFLLLKKMFRFLTKNICSIFLVLTLNFLRITNDCSPLMVTS